MTYKKKLIEVALPLTMINAEAAKQKTMGASPHPQNLHRWWARRPLAATCAVLWASLVDDPSSNPELFPTLESQAVERQRLFSILERLLPWSANNDERVIAEAHNEIVKSCQGELPKIVDPFSGGGAIPFESVRLGLPTFASDLNPVAVLIERAMLEIPFLFKNKPPVNHQSRETRLEWHGAAGLYEDVLAYGRWMQERAKERIGQYYPEVVLDDGGAALPLVWIWARTVESPDPAWVGHVPLVRSWDLSKKPGKPTIWIEPIVDRASKAIHYEVRNGANSPKTTGTRRGHICVATGVPITSEYIRAQGQAGKIGTTLIAVVCEGASGRTYVGSSGVPASIKEAEKKKMGQIPDNPRDFHTPSYGMNDWSDLFTSRQFLALSTFSNLLQDVRQQIITDSEIISNDETPLRDGGIGPTAYADAIVTYLALTIDRCADYWSSACTWHAPNQQLRETFARQAILMNMDFAEANPFSEKMGSWMSMLKTNARAIPTLPLGVKANVKQRDAKARIIEVGNCVVSTDPPYYDNICYADLSDFFYIWLRNNVKDIWPDECATLLSPKAEELIANASRAGSKVAAQKHFELGMESVFRAVAENSDERYPATVFYAFKASESEVKGNVSTGWETFLSGLLKSGFAITATWPIRTELANKIGVNAGDNMLATSIVLACRRRSISATMATRGEFLSALRNEMAEAIKILQVENIAPVDMAQSAIGPGIGIFSRYSKVVEADGQPMTVRTALSLINEVLAEVLSGEESELDADTRFAVTWFEQFGHNPGAFGDADTLAKAKNTTVTGVVESGIAISREGKLRLHERNELSDKWDPTKDSRLTVWETTQYLIRALESSESEASDLLARLGPGIGERARQLAYLLYGICDRKKWAEEGSAYNMLVTAWPQLEKLAQSNSGVDGATDSLFSN